MKNKFSGRFTASLMGLIIPLMIFGVSGCGIKGSPVPPAYAKPPAVSDLQFQVTGNRLDLTWSVPSKQPGDTPGIAGAKVFRLKRSLKNLPCRDCPKVFELMGRVPARSGTMQFQDTVDNGFDYYYKVVLYDDGNHDGEDSNIVHARIE
ncbi:MAG: hypothetical protein JRE21_07530 [Deltaproteobacteria bacterium]|jgi:predicted small lipoprotein YifL|nr:hypothetical protein [Deltaproteobacteria bacterium]